jgi:hypothetical protein
MYGGMYVCMRDACTGEVVDQILNNVCTYTLSTNNFCDLHPISPLQLYICVPPRSAPPAQPKTTRVNTYFPPTTHTHAYACTYVYTSALSASSALSAIIPQPFCTVAPSICTCTCISQVSPHEATLRSWRPGVTLRHSSRNVKKPPPTRFLRVG